MKICNIDISGETVKAGMKENKEGERIKLDIVTGKPSLVLIHAEEGSVA